MENFNEVVYLSLSEENQIKVEHIFVIASILQDHRMRPLSPEEFDTYYEKSSQELERVSNYIKKIPVFESLL